MLLPLIPLTHTEGKKGKVIFPIIIRKYLFGGFSFGIRKVRTLVRDNVNGFHILEEGQNQGQTSHGTITKWLYTLIKHWSL